MNTQVKIDVTIRDNATGETVTLKDEDCNASDDGKPNPYWWDREGGNAGCDCNRKLFFWREKDVELDDEDTPCGDGAYSVELKCGGEVFYSDMDEREASKTS